MNNLEERINQLEKELAKAKIIEQMSRKLNLAKKKVIMVKSIISKKGGRAKKMGRTIPN